jgi:predicted kinase
MILVVMKGMPGSGKSTLSRALGRQLGWPVVDKDMFRPVLPDGAHAYQVMFLQAQDLLRQGFHVICDSPLTGLKAYAAACEISESTRAALRIVECHCSDKALWAQRLAGREKSAHQVSDWQALLAYQEKVRPKMQHAFHHPLLQVDMAKPLVVVTADVIAWLNEKL